MKSESRLRHEERKVSVSGFLAGEKTSSFVLNFHANLGSINKRFGKTKLKDTPQGGKSMEERLKKNCEINTPPKRVA